MKEKNRILVAGIGGASLGTEISKCLNLAKTYEVYGCDISSFAYGHYSSLFEKTFLVNKKKYIESVINICLENNINYIIPGGESPNTLLSDAVQDLKKNNLTLVTNDPKVVSLCSSKKNLFDFLEEKNIRTPKAFSLNDSLDGLEFPCIIKPSEESGGSSFVYVAKNLNELKSYNEILIKNGKIPLIQEYIDHSEGEYTVGILSSTKKLILGSIALRRTFDSKLSILLESDGFLISSGYTQGLIDPFCSIIETCKNISKILQSTGPLNIQGRVKNGQFIPFEVNPRFSASTYLRSLAGLNEIDFYLRHLVNKENSFPHSINYGYYLRSFEEKYVNKHDTIS